jgi:hypothetical protein
MAGRPKGAWSEKRFREALQAAVTEEGAGGHKRLRNIAEQLVRAAEGGDIQAIKEVADRLDGKPAQTVVGDDEADPIRVITEIRRSIVDPRHSDGQGL